MITPDPDRPTGGHLVAEVLQRYGVRSLFTLTGGHISPVLVESKRRGICVIDTRQEQTAAFAADATAQGMPRRGSGPPALAGEADHVGNGERAAVEQEGRGHAGK